MARDDVSRLDGSAVVRKSAAHKYSQIPVPPGSPKYGGPRLAVAYSSRPKAPHKREIGRGQVQPIRIAAPAEGTRYLANFPIMVLAFRNNHQAAVTIPADCVFEVMGSDLDDRFVIVRVRGEEFLVFVSYLHDRGTRLGEGAPLLTECATA